MQVVLNVKGLSRTTGSGRNREMVALYKWPLVQVPLYQYIIMYITSLVPSPFQCVRGLSSGHETSTSHVSYTAM